MQSVKDLYGKAAEEFGKRNLREKLLVAGAAVAVISVVWHVFFFEGRWDRLEQVQTQTRTAQEEVYSLEAEKQELLQKVSEEPSERLQREVQRLEEQLQQLDRRLEEERRELISPRRMAAQLREVLQKSAELELAELTNHPPRQVQLTDLTDSPEELDSATIPDLYRHPLTITFRGSYPAAISALNNMQDLTGRLFWDRLEFTVIDHPTARLRLRVHTLSLERTWLGF